MIQPLPSAPHPFINPSPSSTHPLDAPHPFINPIPSSTHPIGGQVPVCSKNCNGWAVTTASATLKGRGYNRACMRHFLIGSCTCIQFELKHNGRSKGQMHHLPWDICPIGLTMARVLHIETELALWTSRPRRLHFTKPGFFKEC